MMISVVIWHAAEKNCTITRSTGVEPLLEIEHINEGLSGLFKQLPDQVYHVQAHLILVSPSKAANLELKGGFGLERTDGRSLRNINSLNSTCARLVIYSILENYSALSAFSHSPAYSHSHSPY